MTAKEVIKIVCYLLGLDEVVEEIEHKENDSEYAFSAETVQKINRLISCLNLTIEKIASQFVKLRATDELNTDSEGKIGYEEFTYMPISFNWIDDVNGQTAVAFKQMPFHIYLPLKNHAYTLCYNYCPDKIEGLDDVVALLPNLTVRSIAYGVCADFTLEKNLFDESRFWNGKFENEILECVSGAKNRKIKFRAFL